LIVAGKYPSDHLFDLTSAQDYVAQRGQGVIADREHEILGRSDAGIALLRH
jgi:5,5'-dehydrodivanillate O-demethylase oxygenase subunit